MLDELIRVKYVNYNPNDTYGQQYQWIGTDCDKFQKSGATSNQYKIKFSEHFEKQHEKKIQAQQALI